jgi:N-acetylmuramoyl-L-alanine amidase
LTEDGACDRQTWSALVEAGYRLGDRLLYLRRPMLRGDDVGELQQRLNALGFAADRVDGIFGPQTEAALQEFQRNSAITTDGVAGPDVLAALTRLGDRSLASITVAGVREREHLRALPPVLMDRRLVVGESGGSDVLVAALARRLQDAGARVATLHHPEASNQAKQANDFAGDAYLGISVTPGPIRVAYYGTPTYVSEGGQRLASRVVEALDGLGAPVTAAHPMRWAILRETRMPAVVIELGPPSLAVHRSAAIVAAIAGACQAWVETPVDHESTC